MTNRRGYQIPDLPREVALQDVQHTLSALSGRGKLEILFALFGGKTLRFNRLSREVPTLTPKMLIQRLRHLEDEGLLARVVYPAVPPKVEYSLTKAGEAIYPALEQMAFWARERKRHPHRMEKKPAATSIDLHSL